MAQYCANYLTVTGNSDKTELKRFYDSVTFGDKNYFEFERTVPLNGRNEDDIWGTGFMDFTEHNDFNYKDKKIHFNFTTASCPASKWFQQVITQFPTLKFEYSYEVPDLQRAGITFAKNGKTVKEKHFDGSKTGYNLTKFIDFEVKHLGFDRGDLTDSYRTYY